MNAGEIVALCVSVVSLLFVVLTFCVGRKKDNNQEGLQTGQIISDLGYIKSQNEEIKSTLKQQSTDIGTLKMDVAVLKSTVNAHVTDKTLHTPRVRSTKHE